MIKRRQRELDFSRATELDAKVIKEQLKIIRAEKTIKAFGKSTLRLVKDLTAIERDQEVENLESNPDDLDNAVENREPDSPRKRSRDVSMRRRQKIPS